MKVPCSFLHHLLSLFSRLTRPAWRPSVRLSRGFKSVVWFWCRDVTFNEDKSQVRTHNAPAVLAALRDPIRSALKLAGYVNTAAGRRAHTDRPRVLTLYGIT